MKPEKVWQDFLHLPEEARIQVCELIAVLKKQQKTTTAAPTRKVVKLSGEPFIGIWRDRDDMDDSEAWVRQVRTREWREEPANRGDR